MDREVVVDGAGGLSSHQCGVRSPEFEIEPKRIIIIGSGVAGSEAGTFLGYE